MANVAAVEHAIPYCVDTVDHHYKSKNIQLHLTLLVHASACRNKKCSENCTKMKSFLRHVFQCKIRVTGGCRSTCKRVWALLQMHAEQCRVSQGCPVPRCHDLKSHLRLRKIEKIRNNALILRELNKDKKIPSDELPIDVGSNSSCSSRANAKKKKIDTISNFITATTGNETTVDFLQALIKLLGIDNASPLLTICKTIWNHKGIKGIMYNAPEKWTNTKEVKILLNLMTRSVSWMKWIHTSQVKEIKLPNEINLGPKLTFIASGKFPRLTSIDLTGFSNIDTNVTEVLYSIFYGDYSNLQSLNLTDSNITDTIMMEVARRCSNLQTLNLTRCFNITDISVVEVARRCSNLQALNLSHCNKITDASVVEVATRCSNLQSINLADCWRITDNSVSEVARRCSNLQTLDLTLCNSVTDVSIMLVARQCSNLQSLNVSHSDNITDVSIMLVGRQYSNLHTLNLSHCKNLTDASVQEVARGCSNLQTLYLVGCRNITSACKYALRQSHPQLQLYTAVL